MKHKLLLTALLVVTIFSITKAQVTVTITVGGPTTFCIGNNVLLSSNIVPASIYQYQWVESGVNILGANTSTYTANATGSYVLKATALNGNIYTSNTIAIIVNPLPTAPSVAYNSPAIICNGSSINLSDNSSTNVSYQWYLNNNLISNGTNNNYNANSNGNYKLVITNLTTGCSNTSQDIIVGEMPKIISDTIVTCGNSTTISLTNSNFSYSTLPASCNIDMSSASISSTTQNVPSGGWNAIICYGGNVTVNGSGGHTFVVEYGGTLNGFGGGGGNIAYVKSGGIYNYNSGGGGGNVVYYEPGAIINAGTTQTVQCNSIGIIYPSNTSGLCNNLNYLWSNGATTPTITVNPTQPTTYSVTVSNGSLTCTDQVLVTPNGITPNITASGATTFCQGGSVVLTSSSATGNTWSNGATTQSITVSSSGNYSVTVSNGGCSVTSSPTVVTVNPTPATPTITASGATTFCQGGFVTLTSSSTSGNNWSNGATTQSINVNNSGSYSVSISNGNCTVSSSSTNITVNPTPTVSFTIPAITNYTGANFNLTGSPIGGVFNGAGVSGSIFHPNVAGLGNKIISYNYTNANGCSGTASQNTLVYDTVICSQTIHNYDTIITHIQDTLTTHITLHDTLTTNLYDTLTTHISINDTIPVYDSIHYAIYDTLTIQLYDTITTHITINDTITHYLAVTDTLLINAVLTGVPGPNNTNLIKVFPNPASDHLIINYGNYASLSGYSVKVTNALAQTVYSSVIVQQQVSIDLSTWSGKGTYILSIMNGSGAVIETRKIVLQ